MRIVKYILLLVLLAVIGLTVYVATQESEFEVEKSKVINAQKSVVFDYVNDYKNWEDFGSWKDEDPNMTFTYPDNTIGVGAFYSWKGKSGDGKTETIFISENDSISQKVTFSGNEGKAYLTFKDTVGGTKVTWHSKGKLDFMSKVYAVFKGGSEKMMGSIYEKTLAKLDKVVSFEINTFDIKVDGISQKTGGYYLQQQVTSKATDVQKNVSRILPTMLKFFKDNGLSLTGKPFILYKSNDGATVSFAVCLPMAEEIYTSDGSDYTSGKLETFQAVKTTLKGDYSHGKEAWGKTRAYIKKNNLAENKSGSYLEVYNVSASEVKNPSKWITEIYVPVGNSAPVNETEVSENSAVVKPAAVTAKPATTTVKLANTTEKPSTSNTVKPTTNNVKPVAKPVTKPATSTAKPATSTTSKPTTNNTKPVVKPSEREARVIE